MNKYKVKLKNVKSGSESVTFEHADSKEMLAALCEQRGLAILEILEEEPIEIAMTPPNLQNLEGLADFVVDEQAMAAAQRAHQAAQAQNPHVAPAQTPVPRGPAFPQPPHQQSPQVPPQNVIEFVDNGVAYKIENGIVYKKDWVEVDPSEFKVMMKEKKKEFSQDSILIFRKDWVPLEDPKHG
jgi:hypothetical protein